MGAMFGGGGGGSVNLEKGLIGHWMGSHGNLSATTKDLTPYGNDGTVTGSDIAVTTDRKGQSGKAYSFNGGVTADDKITV